MRARLVNILTVFLLVLSAVVVGLWVSSYSAVLSVQSAGSGRVWDVHSGQGVLAVTEADGWVGDDEWRWDWGPPPGRGMAWVCTGEQQPRARSFLGVRVSSKMATPVLPVLGSPRLPEAQALQAGMGRQPPIIAHQVVLPYWMLVMLLGFVPAVRGLRHLALAARSQQRQRRGQCIACGYDLRASTGRCPECGLSSSAAPSSVG